MLHSRDIWDEEVDTIADSCPGDVARPGQLTDSQQPSRYGRARKLNWPAIIITTLLHVALITAIVQIRSESVRKPVDQLTVVNLSSPPPPAPPPAAAEPPPPAAPAVVAPVPVVKLPQPTPPPIATREEPQQTPTESAVVETPPTPSKASAPKGPPVATGPVQAGDIGTKMISAVPPRYPVESRRRREEGTVILSLTLGVDGRVESISIANSSGSSRLDKAALRAVRKWRWAPTVRDGHPVMVKGQVKIPFVLQN